MPSSHIVAGNGSDELIDLLMRMFVGPGENILIPAPTFGMYAIAAGICGGETISVDRDENFEIDVEAIALASNPKSKAVFFASPNNPTGNIATEAQIRGLLETGLLVVVDETYYEFCGHTVMPLGGRILQPRGVAQFQQVGRCGRLADRFGRHAA